MATTFECMYVPSGWSRAYINQLAQYVRARDIEGYSYGNKKLFEKRHKEILEWVEGYEDLVYSEDAPKFDKRKLNV